MGRPCQVWISERLLPYLGTLEPCVDTHRTVSYIAWSYWGQERSGGTEALQMFFISGPQGKAVTTTPGSFCSGAPRQSGDALTQSGYLSENTLTPPLCHVNAFMETLAVNAQAWTHVQVYSHVYDFIWNHSCSSLIKKTANLLFCLLYHLKRFIYTVYIYRI